ncbi:MAG: peptidoglycan DD-metalloendopeptidase family protein [Oscillospiraceae bacterium]|nr:peptidoglycan DD-metalloendopeptidase family protein [Oscillospiraceae bacterium]
MQTFKFNRKIAVYAAMAMMVMCTGIVFGFALWQSADVAEYAEYLPHTEYAGYTEEAPSGPEKYVLKVEDEIVGALHSREEIYDVLVTILEEYSTETTEYIWFVPDISVVRQVVDEDIVKDTEALLEILAPSNEESGLAVESVETEVVEKEEIPYETEYVEDDTLTEGETMLISEGQSGLLQLTETVVRLNGVEQSRDISRFAQPPVAERIAIGTMPRGRQYIWPADGPITSGFGPRVIAVGSRNHRGLDIGGRLGDPIFAADYGEVIFSGWNGGFGNAITIRHDNGDETLYAHLNEIFVSVGDWVYQGQIIGAMGTTGTSTGVHLHFEIIIDGVQVDPILYLP